MEQILDNANQLLFIPTTTEEDYKCLINNKDNIYYLLDQLNTLRQIHHNFQTQYHELLETINEMKKTIRNLEMDNNLLYFELQHYKPSDNSNDTLTITD